MKVRIATGTAIFLLLASYATSSIALTPTPYSIVPQALFTEMPTYGVPNTPVRRPVGGVPSASPSRPPVRRPTPGPVLLTPRPTDPPTTHRLGGIATWYCLSGVSGCQKDHPNGLYAAAGPSLRLALGGGWRGRLVTVSVPGKAPVTVRLTDWCACPAGHTIDLYADAFGQLGDLSRGVLDVEISW